ncbi:MAG: hypothetical protein OHK0046_40320 [Anaerolineae bacterium]
MRILLVQLADIGNLILTTPALAALRAAQPDAHLTLLTTSHAAPVMDTALVDEIITFDRRSFNSSTAFFRPANLRRVLALGRYDAVVFCHHFTFRLGTLKFALIALATRARRRIGLQNGNGWFLNESVPDAGFGARHEAQYLLDLVGLLGAPTTPQPAQVRRNAYPVPSGHYVVMHPGSGGYSLARRWSAAGFAAVGDALHRAYGVQVVLVGGAEDNTEAVSTLMHTPPLDLAGRTTLAETAAIIAGARLYIGADSGVMHLAAAVKTPVVAIFGPSNHAAWQPWAPESRAVVVRSAPECSPCSYVGHGVGLREGCEARTCMRMVTPEMVLAAATSILDMETDAQPTPASTRAAGDDSAVGMLSGASDAIDRIRILGLPVDAITYEAWLARIETWVQQKDRVHHVCTTNPEFMMIAQRDPNFHNILQRADLCVPDGVGLLWAARHLGRPLPERVTGSDGLPVIAARAAEKGWRLFFLGAAPGIAEQAAAVLRQQHPTLHIVGTYSGSPAPDEEDDIVARINASSADILFVAYGAPAQDKWIARNTSRLNVAMAMGVGGAFDFIAGVVPRAPRWMREAGLEWLYRLYLQPRRIGRMMRLPRFVLAVLRRGER